MIPIKIIMVRIKVFPAEVNHLLLPPPPVVVRWFTALHAPCVSLWWPVVSTGRGTPSAVPTHACTPVVLSVDATCMVSWNHSVEYRYTQCRTGQIFEQSRSSEETDRNVDVSTAKVFVSTNVYISICFFTAT